MQGTSFQDVEVLPVEEINPPTGFVLYVPKRGGNFRAALPFFVGFLTLSAIVAGWMFAAASFPPTAVIQIKFRPEITYRVPLPVSAFTEISATISMELPVKATGKVELPDGHASGRVRFTSVESSPVSFGKDAVIARAGDVQYRLAQAVTVPGFSGLAGIAEGTVIADRPGPVGNSPGIGNFIISPNVRVQSLGAIAGGNTRTISVISETDISEVRKSLEMAISQNAREALQGAVPAGYISLRNMEISAPTFTLPATGTEMTGQRGKAVATVKGKAFYPEILLRDYAYPVGSSSLAGPEFKEINEVSSTLVYTRKVIPGPVLDLLEGWQGGKRELNGLVVYLRSLPEVSEVMAPDLRDFRGFYLKLQVQE